MCGNGFNGIVHVHYCDVLCSDSVSLMKLEPWQEMIREKIKEAEGKKLMFRPRCNGKSRQPIEVKQDAKLNGAEIGDIIFNEEPQY